MAGAVTNCWIRVRTRGLYVSESMRASAASHWPSGSSLAFRESMRAARSRSRAAGALVQDATHEHSEVNAVKAASRLNASSASSPLNAASFSAPSCTCVPSIVVPRMYWVNSISHFETNSFFCHLSTTWRSTTWFHKCKRVILETSFSRRLPVNTNVSIVPMCGIASVSASDS
jgi:hypothetical protein